VNRLLIESVLAFLALPGIVAFLLPLVMAPGGIRSFDPRAVLLLCPGVVLLLWCVVEFYSSGKGTLAPWTPTRHLVMNGPYAYSRNPMYIAVVLILWAWALGFRSSALVWYAAGMTVAFHFRVLWFEEPWLAETHGEAWQPYKETVPRWIGLRRATVTRPRDTT
jgi:protein-S-isoprenylcysteine O-methyltransferase Ste14